MALLDTSNKRITVAAILLAVAIVLFVLNAIQNNGKQKYISNKGDIFGTTYHIIYETSENYAQDIEDALQGVDNSLSMFNPISTLSKINDGDSVTDAHVLKCLKRAAEIHELSDGALDITVRPLVNAWGFGTADKPTADPQLIDSILGFIGFHRVHIKGNLILKDDPRITLDASAIAKGYGCDVVADLLKAHGVENFLVEIGGEVVCQGKNKNGELWHVGINKPNDDPTGTNNQAQAIIEGDLALATSGSYRQFYYEDGVRRSHTIDPRTGYPVSNSLLSATIIAPDCMTADGLATACMVMGLQQSLEVIEQLPNTECYLIYEEDGKHLVQQSSGFSKYLVQE